MADNLTDAATAADSKNQHDRRPNGRHLRKPPATGHEGRHVETDLRARFGVMATPVIA